MSDAMTPETIRAALHEMAQMEFLGHMLDREYHAALTHALAALDALARVRALCERGPFSGSWGSGYEMALADVRRALDGEADR